LNLNFAREKREIEFGLEKIRDDGAGKKGEEVREKQKEGEREEKEDERGKKRDREREKGREKAKEGEGQYAGLHCE
jgi:hypothetical protein